METYPTYIEVIYPSLQIVRSGRMLPTGFSPVENDIPPTLETADIIDVIFHRFPHEYITNLLKIVIGGGGSGSICDEYYTDDAGHPGEKIGILIDYPPDGSILCITAGFGGAGRVGNNVAMPGQNGKSTVATLFFPNGVMAWSLTAKGGDGGGLRRRSLVMIGILVMVRAVLSIGLNGWRLGFGSSSRGGSGGVSITNVSYEYLCGLEPRRL